MFVVLFEHLNTQYLVFCQRSLPWQMNTLTCWYQMKAASTTRSSSSTWTRFVFFFSKLSFFVLAFRWIVQSGEQQEIHWVGDMKRRSLVGFSKRCFGVLWSGAPDTVRPWYHRILSEFSHTSLIKHGTVCLFQKNWVVSLFCCFCL